MRFTTKFAIAVTIVVFAAMSVAVVFFSRTAWDTVPAWLGGIGGVLGGFAALYALVVALKANEEHVSWSKVTNRTDRYERPTGFEIVNVSKNTFARLEKVEEVTGDIGGALDVPLELPVTVAPGASIPLSVSRSMANSYPTIVRITWHESAGNDTRYGKAQRSQTLYL